MLNRKICRSNTNLKRERDAICQLFRNAIRKYQTGSEQNKRNSKLELFRNIFWPLWGEIAENIEDKELKNEESDKKYDLYKIELTKSKTSQSKWKTVLILALIDPIQVTYLTQPGFYSKLIWKMINRTKPNSI